MSDIVAQPVAPTRAYLDLTQNLDHARDLIRAGRYLQHLEVGAFDVADLYPLKPIAAAPEQVEALLAALDRVVKEWR